MRLIFQVFRKQFVKIVMKDFCAYDYCTHLSIKSFYILCRIYCVYVCRNGYFVPVGRLLSR